MFFPACFDAPGALSNRTVQTAFPAFHLAPESSYSVVHSGVHRSKPQPPMAEQKDKGTGKSFFDSLPSYLAGFAAVATATVAVLTYLNHHDAETTPITEPEVNLEHVGAVPSVEVRARPTQPGGASATGASQAKPTLGSALHPARCASYVGTWQLSSGELLTFNDDERVEVRASADAAPRFGRYNCSGRNEEILYLMIDREGTLTFTESGDGKLYQRTDQRSTTAPLTATRAPAK